MDEEHACRHPESCDGCTVGPEAAPRCVCPSCSRTATCDQKPQFYCDDFIMVHSAAHWEAQKRSEELGRKDDGEEARE